jgi:hypothetical protein
LPEQKQKLIQKQKKKEREIRIAEQNRSRAVWINTSLWE